MTPEQQALMARRKEQALARARAKGVTPVRVQRPGAAALPAVAQPATVEVTDGSVQCDGGPVADDLANELAKVLRREDSLVRQLQEARHALKSTQDRLQSEVERRTPSEARRTWSRPESDGVACQADDLPRGPKDKLALVYDCAAHRRAPGSKRKRAEPSGSGASAVPEHFAVGSARLMARALENAAELVLSSVKTAAVSSGAGPADEAGQLRLLKRTAAAGVSGMKKASMDADARARHELQKERAAKARADRERRFLHQRMPAQRSKGEDRGKKRHKNTRLSAQHAAAKRKLVGRFEGRR